jgi:hypothetical protein
MKITVFRCCDVPMPGLTQFNTPGFFFACAMKSLTVSAGRLELTTSTEGAHTTPPIGTKLSSLHLMLGCMRGFATRAGLTNVQV